MIGMTGFRNVAIHEYQDLDLKIVRAIVEDKYKELIGALYSNDDTYKIEADITYRDGRKGTIETSIHVNEV